MENDKNDWDALKFSVLVSVSQSVHPPDFSHGDVDDDRWDGDCDVESTFGALLSPEEMAAFHQEYYLKFACKTLGSMGAPGFDAQHMVPAVSLEGEGGDISSVYVTPWTERVKAVAIEAVAGRGAETVPVLDSKVTMTFLDLPLWGEEWGRVVKVLEGWFADYGSVWRPGPLLSLDGDPVAEARGRCDSKRLEWLRERNEFLGKEIEKNGKEVEELESGGGGKN